MAQDKDPNSSEKLFFLQMLLKPRAMIRLFYDNKTINTIKIKNTQALCATVTFLYQRNRL